MIPADLIAQGMPKLQLASFYNGSRYLGRGNHKLTSSALQIVPIQGIHSSRYKATGGAHKGRISRLFQQGTE